MLKQPIYINGFSSVSALGFESKAILKKYQNQKHYIQPVKLDDSDKYAAILPDHVEVALDKIRQENKNYNSVDKSVIMAMLVARQAVQNAGWHSSDHYGINFGSSRGATALFEKFHTEFLANGYSTALSSPTTTLGNISSWIAHDLQTEGPEISHSITCSTALHAILNASAWLQSGLTSQFLVGGSEACITPFTIAQMEALKIYAKVNNAEAFPCLALDQSKTKNTMVLGEAAGAACLSLTKTSSTLGKIMGIGYATELLQHNVSLSTDGTCFQKSMQMALGNLPPEDVDIVLTHTPGTIQGDRAEYHAISAIFSKKLPALTTNKWKLGHTLGASGMLSLEMALLMLQHQEFFTVPYLQQKRPDKIERILINAVGFGGNAVSILLER